MEAYFFDTNTLVERYLPGKASPWINGVVAKRKLPPLIFISQIARVEIVSAFYKLERTQKYNPALTNMARNQFERHRLLSDPARSQRIYEIIEITDAIYDRSVVLLEKYRSGKPNAIRSLDAIQLACAIEARLSLSAADQAIFTFVSIDKQLQGCARQENFPVIDPTRPPKP